MPMFLATELIPKFHNGKLPSEKNGLLNSLSNLNKNRIDNKRINYSNISDMWNLYNSPKVARLTAKRKSNIKNLLKEFTEADCEIVFKKIPTIPYLTGQNEHKWIANFDYVIRPDKFVKILEGGWDTPPSTTKGSFDEWNQ